MAIPNPELIRLPEELYHANVIQHCLNCSRNYHYLGLLGKRTLDDSTCHHIWTADIKN